jgi:hypothetical protein
LFISPGFLSVFIVNPAYLSQVAAISNEAYSGSLPSTGIFASNGRVLACTLAKLGS